MGNVWRWAGRLAAAVAAVAAAGCGDDGRSHEAEAARLIAGMGLRSRAAQIVVPPLRLGADTAAAAAQLRQAAAGSLPGVWVEGGDATEAAAAIARLRLAAPLPILTAAHVDAGVPLGGATALPAAALVAAIGSNDDARVAGELMAREARAVGIDLGFVAAPPTNVLGPLAPGGRSPWRTGAGLRALVEGARSTGLAIGVVSLWTEGPAAPARPVLTWDRARLEAVELAILREALADEPEAIAFGAIRLPSLTGDSTPLPLSPAAIRGLARRQLGFRGLVVMDLAPAAMPDGAVGRGAVSEGTISSGSGSSGTGSTAAVAGGTVPGRMGAGEAAVRAVAAGADLLVRVEDPSAVVDALVAGVESGRISPARVTSAARRVLAARLRAEETAGALHRDSLGRALALPAAKDFARRTRRRVATAIPPPTRELQPPDSPGIDSVAGMDPRALARVDSILKRALEDSVFTGAALAVGRRGSLVRLSGYGPGVDPRMTIFDVASLTKVLGTTMAVSILVERGEMELDEPVRRYVREWRGDRKEDVTVRHLLTHTSGLPSGLWLFGSARSPEQALRQTLEQELVRAPGESVEYSDLGMILLAEAAERAAGMPIDRFLALNVYAPLGMQGTMYLPPVALKPGVVATAETTEREFALHGVVHDANAFRLGGVAGHAGLFSTARDLAVFARTILDGGSYGSTIVLLPATVAAFTRLQDAAGTRALGWDTPADRSSAGRLFSASSYGHTGYTGTSLWIDPRLDLFVVLLTNRTYTGASSADILRLRAAVHEAIAGAVADRTVRPRRGARGID